ncbi:hypothetical protein DPMN_085469 [Dreissena polymorpha]|uniref:Uncharacterized protein n=1 Tax=Dreissena polymorpha TaxID=45954 RepID=A0A9D4BCX1_DREPO|nr:hypothetical protein DPMN_085469 [Dreissena polymorpha]
MLWQAFLSHVASGPHSRPQSCASKHSLSGTWQWQSLPVVEDRESWHTETSPGLEHFKTLQSASVLHGGWKADLAVVVLSVDVDRTG